MADERKPLTRSRIERAKVPPGTDEIRLWDSLVTGFGVRCLPGGSKTFVFRYRPHGGGRSVNPRLLKLGAFPSISLDDARDAARIHAGDVAKGKDPALERAEERRKDRAGLGKLLGVDGPYERHLRARGIVNIKLVLSSLRRGLKPYMTVDVSDLTRHDIVTAIDALNQIGKPGAAADLRTHARGFLEWAVGQGLAQFNSLAGLRRPGKTRAQRLKTALKGKALTDDEIVRVWRVAQHWQDRSLCGEAVSGSFGALVQLGLLTGMRRSELAQLRRDHIRSDTDKSGVGGERFHIPASITKTGASHAIPITAPARAIIAVQPVTLSPLLLPSARTGGRLRGWGSLVERFQRDSSVKFNLHDLRRTVRTLMSRLGIAEDVAELAIGHQRADLIARYNRDEAWKARVAAFERVSEHVTALLADDDRSNVVLMHGRGQRPTG